VRPLEAPWFPTPVAAGEAARSPSARAGTQARLWEACFVPGRAAVRQEQRPERPRPVPARREAVRRAAAPLELWSEWQRQPEVSAIRRDAAAVPSGFRQAAAQFEFAAQEPALQAAAIAWRPPVAGAVAPELACPSGARVAGSAQPVAWVQRARALPPEVPAGARVRVAPRSGEPAERYVRAVRPRVAAPHAEAVPGAASDARVVLPPEEVAASDAAVLPPVGVAVSDAAAVPQRVAGAAVRDAEALRPAAAAWWVQQRAAERPSAAPWVFRRGPILPWFPAPQRAARSAHGMRRLRAASRSEQTWQAARCEVLS
jgi:hypothetical protein